MNDSPRSGDASPWGRIDHAKVLAPGIVSVSTQSHGGIHLDTERNDAMPAVFRKPNGWYEEDCDWAMVALVYPQAFDEKARAAAPRSVMTWQPDAYEAWSGTVIPPGQSRKKDERAFYSAHAPDWIVRSAFGSWHAAVPVGWVGVYAMPGATYLASAGTTAAEPRPFLVPEEEYEARFEQREACGLFVCDPERHPAWEPKKPKDEQNLNAPAHGAVEPDDEPQGPRP